MASISKLAYNNSWPDPSRAVTRMTRTAGHPRSLINNMETLSERISALRARYARTLLADRPQHIQELGNWAIDNGATHAITVTPDIYVSTGYDPERHLKPIMRRLAKAIAHDVRHVPHRKLGFQQAIDQTVWMFGFVETETKTGMAYPHFHGFLALRTGEDRKMKAVLANRWGKGRAAPALRPVFREAGAFPDFDVSRLNDTGGWFRYGMKNTSLAEFTFWSHIDLLGRDT